MVDHAQGWQGVEGRATPFRAIRQRGPRRWRCCCSSKATAPYPP